MKEENEQRVILECFVVVFIWRHRDNELSGSLSTSVVERRRSTGSEAISIFICLDATKFGLLRVLTIIEMILRSVGESAAREMKMPTSG